MQQDISATAKYQSAKNDYHLNALREGFIYFADPNKWPDRNDIRFVLRLGNDREAAIKELVYGEEHVPILTQYNISPEMAFDVLKKLSDEQIEDLLSDVQKANFGKCFGIFCCTTEVNSKEFCQKYKEKNGSNLFAIIFKYQELKEFCEASGIFCRQVNYVPNPIEFIRKDRIPEKERMEIILTQKVANVFEWESEIRFIKSFHKSHYEKRLEIEDNERRLFLSPDLIKEIQVYHAADTNLENKIEALIKVGPWSNVRVVRALKP